MSKIKISKPLPKNMEMDVLRFARDNKDKQSSLAVMEAVLKKFDSKKWQTVTGIEFAHKNGQIDYRTKKKRDLGHDHLSVRVYADRYIITVFEPSSYDAGSFKFEKKFYEIIS